MFLIHLVLLLFEFTAPVISSVVPNRGLPSGGELVTISGEHLGTGSDLNSVIFCRTAGTIVTQTPTKVTACGYICVRVRC